MKKVYLKETFEKNNTFSEKLHAFFIQKSTLMLVSKPVKWIYVFKQRQFYGIFSLQHPFGEHNIHFT